MAPVDPTKKKIIDPAQQAKDKRAEAARKRAEHKEEHLQMMAKYDKNGDQKLQRSELVELLTATKSSTEAGVKPTDEEISWILRVADKPKRGEVADGCIDLFEIEDALEGFECLAENRQELEEAMAPYITAEGSREKGTTFPVNRLHEYLSDLNGGVEALQSDEAKVLKWLPREWHMKGKSETIAVSELLPATALWYAEVKPVESKCCVLQ